MRNRYNTLKRETWQMPNNMQKIAMLEEAIRIADQYMSEEEAYRARMDYSDAVLECGCPERIFVSFAWCIAAFERNPAAYSAYSIIWQYKWVLNQSWRVPQFSLAQIDALFEDFKQKCLQYGYSLRAYHQQKVNVLLSQGRIDEAQEHYKAWRAAPRDSLSDCKACEQNLFGVYYFMLNQNKRGVQVVKPILDGKLSCRSVPQATYSHVIRPLLKLGDYEEAVRIANKAYRTMEGPEYLEEYGIFLEFFTVTDMKKAVKLYEKTIRIGLECRMPWDRFRYLLSVRHFLQQWHATKRRKVLLASDLVTLPWLDEEIAALADAFNARNGNTYLHTYMAEQEENIRRLVAAYRSAQKQGE